MVDRRIVVIKNQTKNTRKHIKKRESARKGAGN
jgi:hypothetical protein